MFSSYSGGGGRRATPRKRSVSVMSVTDGQSPRRICS